MMNHTQVTNNQVVVTQKIAQADVDRLKDAGFEVVYHDSTRPWLEVELQTAVSPPNSPIAIICLLTDKITAELMDAAPNLKLIANVAVGYDNINVAAATKRGIVVTNTPDVLTETTADLAFGLLLAIARRIPEADSHMRAGKYKRFELFPEMLGVDVFGKTLGIVGMGRIGTAVAHRGALGFNMPILYTANHAKEAAEQELGARRVPFAQLLQESDFISINAPLTSQTRHLFTLREFQQMKQSACLINTARGPLIKEADLATALQQGLIRGAAIDVFENEPAMHPALHALHRQLIVAPHIGSASIETRHRMSALAVENVIIGLQGNCPPNALNPEAVD